MVKKLNFIEQLCPTEEKVEKKLSESWDFDSQVLFIYVFTDVIILKFSYV